MSIYDGSRSGEGDSDRTSRAKARLTKIITEQMKARGYKVWIKEEVPATFLDTYKPVCYHIDLGVLVRNKTSDDEYHFIAIEIDDDSHATFRRERRDKIRDETFFNSKGIITCRIPLSKIFEERADEKSLFDKWIWMYYLMSYRIFPDDDINVSKSSERNRQFSILLKENSSTKCLTKNCDHLAIHHDLTGCQYRGTNKAKEKCYCTNPYYRSDA